MLKEDYELQAAEVQQLAGRDALAAFFARLGYDTNNRIVQTADALGLNSDSLKPVVTHIERLASQDAGLFEVYLFELKSVTVKTTQNLVKNFRDRMGDYMLVMTDDYQRLDFVLVERYQSDANRTPGGTGTGTGPLSPTATRVSVRPRVLTVQRHNPDAVAMRVLRRFSYTEPDTFAQHDKLLSAYDVAEWSKPYFNNRALFADYYLTDRLSTLPEWNGDADADALKSANKKLRELYEDVREEFSNQKEGSIRQKLYEPVFTVLGFRFEAGKAAASADHAPDYVLYHYSRQLSEATASASNQQPKPQQPQPLAVCLTYTWSRNLDGKDEGRDSETPDENPGATVVSLLESGIAPWAIVTNGKIWRLYSAKAHSRATNYYEIDLEETLAVESSRRGEALRYFWLFFRAAAFLPTEQTVDGEQTTLSFLDMLLRSSERYAKELGERLKERVFEQIFPQFARGFITYARRSGNANGNEGGVGILPADFDKLDEAARARVLEPFFSGTLTFLYRLLFLFYAESRDLLPVREQRGYYARSLESLKRKIAATAGTIKDDVPAKTRNNYSDLTTEFYDALLTLFRAVDQGNPDLNVPVYNGGLFMTAPDAADTSAEGKAARFLANCKIPDREMALGLDLMARDLDDRTHALVFIDYKSLGVRQLGSIYEGLLEFRLRVAPTEMALVKGKKTEEVVPYTEAVAKKLPILKSGRGKDAADRTLPKGSVYLENDRRERKATGSYYTPDYIVKYIVENTVGPVLREKFERLLPVFREAEQALRAERQRYEALKKQGRPGAGAGTGMRVGTGTKTGMASGDNPENLVYVKYKERLVEPFYEMRVLDPAMGSGHFLVEAVDFVTDRMADFLSRFGWNPVTHELSRTRQEIRAEMEAQGVTVDYSKLDDLNLLKRRVLKSCIYGVDLNPMAVELAKVSLWLDCFTLGAPLSFLDHHLKAGNSLIGANVAEVQDALKRDLWGNQFAGLLSATSLMQRVGKLSDTTVAQVAESRAVYQQAYDALAPFKRLLDVWLSEHFGNKGAQFATTLYAQALVEDRVGEIADAANRQKITAARELATGKRFFHWELEFPEVFYSDTDRKPDGGFDAVIGNPPYVRQEGLGEDKTVFQLNFKVFNSIGDLYTYFIERGHVLLRASGRFGMITANKFMRANYGAALRNFLAGAVRLEKLIDFGDLPVFGDATTYPIVILSSQRQRNGAAIEYALLKSLPLDDLTPSVTARAATMPESAFSGTNWSLAATSSQTVLDKLKAVSVTLEQYTGGKILYGIKTGFNEAFYIDRVTRDKLIAQDPKSAEIIKPLVVGEDVKRYDMEYEDRFMVFTRRGIHIDKYPAIRDYLEQYRTRLEPKPKNWDDTGQETWQGRKAGPYQWYEIQDNVAYYKDFDKPKIMYPVIASSNKFTIVEGDYYSNDKTFIIPLEDYYLLALLNSSTSFFFFRSELSDLRGGFLEYRAQTLLFTPIRKINFTTPADERARLVGELQTAYRAVDSAGVLASVAELLPVPSSDNSLTVSPQSPVEKSDVVHNLLAYLAEQMITMNKEKRALQREFTDWLVGTLRVIPSKDGKTGIEALTGKARLADFLGDYQKNEPALTETDLFDILTKNRARLGVKLGVGEGTLAETVRRRYVEAVERGLPLKERLAATDKLIDTIVYRLYGLTEAEIAIVEGRAE
jgi:hypothetical protein